MDQASKFWDRWADRYAAQPITDEAAYQHKLEVTRTHFQTDSEVLEFGCGTGSTALLHAPFVKHIRALDFSQRMIEICQAKAEAQQVTNVAFEQADIAHLQVPGAGYDVVMGMSILHLLKDKQAVLAKIHQLLKPGGVFISSTTCMGDTMGFFKLLAPVGKFMGLLPQLDIMTRSELRDSLNTSGFDIETDWQSGKGKAVFIVARKPV